MAYLMVLMMVLKTVHEMVLLKVSKTADMMVKGMGQN